MKTPSKILVASLFGAALTLSAVAGPGIEYWQNRGALKSAPAASVVKPAVAAGGVTCPAMLVPNVRTSRETGPFTSVACTPEMLKNDPRCQKACGM